MASAVSRTCAKPGGGVEPQILMLHQPSNARRGLVQRKRSTSIRPDTLPAGVQATGLNANRKNRPITSRLPITPPRNIRILQDRVLKARIGVKRLRSPATPYRTRAQ